MFNNSHDSIQGPVESSFSVHVLSVLPLGLQVNAAHIVAFHFFIFGRLETGKAHDFHHVNLILNI